MVKYLVHPIILLIIIFTYGCKNIDPPLTKYKPLNKQVFIDVVEKKTIIVNFTKSIYSEKTKKSIIHWLDKDIKTNGYEGYLEIRILDIITNENIIENGLMINISAKIEFIIYNPILDSRKIILIKAEEYGQLTGNFTLNDKSLEVDNIIKRLIENFSTKLSQEVS